MIAGTDLRTIWNEWRLVILASGAGFLLGIALDMAILLTLAGMAIGALIVNHRLRARTKLVTQALDNMTQGLCMFDSAARLVLCNERYSELYGITTEQTKPGTPLRTCSCIASPPARFSAIPTNTSPNACGRSPRTAPSANRSR